MRPPKDGTSRRSSLRLAAGILLFVSLLFLPQSIGAQVVRGHLYDARTGEAVNHGTVTLRSGQELVVAQTEADSLGAFTLPAPSPGSYSLLVESLGYRSTSTHRFDVGAGEPATVDVHLDPKPFGLDSLNVEAERQPIIPFLEAQGFYKRAEEGFGYFIQPEEIETRNPRFFNDLLRDIPGLQVSVHGDLRWGSRCRYVTPWIWIDGIRVDDGKRGAPLSQFISIGEIVAIEVYQGPASIPLQYGGLEGQCAILIWTKG